MPITAAIGVLVLLLWFALSQHPSAHSTSAAEHGTGATGSRHAGAAVASALATPTVPPPPQSGCVTGRTLPSGVSTRTLKVSGVVRTYVLAVPTAGTQARPLPLVFTFHDLNQTTDDLEAYTRLADQGTKAGFAVVAPVGAQGRWNFTRSDAVGPDDVLFAGLLLNELTGRMCLDAKRIFAAGYADGANMVFTLACGLSGRFAAAVTVGSGVLPAGCAAPTTSVLEIHGTADQIAPYGGGGAPRPAPFAGVVAQPVEDRLTRYATALGCGPARQTSQDTAAWVRVVWNGCPAGREVGLLAMQGAGHTWPGAAARPTLGPTSGGFDATVVALTYFGYTPTSGAGSGVSGSTAATGPLATPAPAGGATPSPVSPTPGVSPSSGPPAAAPSTRPSGSPGPVGTPTGTATTATAAATSAPASTG